MADNKPHPLKRAGDYGVGHPALYGAEKAEHRDDVYEFVRAVDEYRRVNSTKFPRTSDLFDVLFWLGYRKTAPRLETINDVAPRELTNFEQIRKFFLSISNEWCSIRRIAKYTAILSKAVRCVVHNSNRDAFERADGKPNLYRLVEKGIRRRRTDL